MLKTFEYLLRKTCSRQAGEKECTSSRRSVRWGPSSPLRWSACSLGVFCFLAGCALIDSPAPVPWQSVHTSNQNPVFLQARDPQVLWEAIVDVIDDDFQIEREEPVRRYGDILTEGRLDTKPLIGASLMEPWRSDSASGRQRLESTLQTIRRRAVVRVIPEAEGYLVEVAVYKDLEDLVQPSESIADRAVFEYDESFSQVAQPAGVSPRSQGWIPIGRDPVLEEKIIAKIAERLENPPMVFD